MLGNSFTFANHMPDILARLTGAEVVHHTRGGARLAEQLNEKTRMGKLTQSALYVLPYRSQSQCKQHVFLELI